MQTYLKEYIRKEKKGQPIGVVVAKKVSENKVRIGFSLCNPKDKFDKELGERIALSRAESDEGFELPKSKKYQDLLYERFFNITRRAERYFKVKDIY